MSRSIESSAVGQLRDIEGAILDLLVALAGPPPSPQYTCSNGHQSVRYQMCTGITKPRNIGRWFAVCWKCGPAARRWSWSDPPVDFQFLARTEPLRGMLATRSELRMNAKRSRRRTKKVDVIDDSLSSLPPVTHNSSTSNQRIGGSTSRLDSAFALGLAELPLLNSTFIADPRIITVIAWTKYGLHHTISLRHSTGAFRLVDYKLALGRYGIENAAALERYDYTTQAWRKLRWNEDILPEAMILIRLHGVPWQLSMEIYM